ncbi:MAG: hypothetical protein AAF713_22730 [Pseudomonadota bacterium]
MTCTDLVNDHVRKPGRQAFEVDAGGVVGRLISAEVVATEINVSGTRAGALSDGFSQDGVAFFEVPTACPPSRTAPSLWSTVHPSGRSARASRAIH